MLWTLEQVDASGVVVDAVVREKPGIRNYKSFFPPEKCDSISSTIFAIAGRMGILGFT